MARVEVNLNGRAYPILCEDGEEARVLEAGSIVEQKLSELRPIAGQSTDLQLMVMAALMLADELMEFRDQPLPAALPTGTGDAVARLADRIEAIAARLDRA